MNTEVLTVEIAKLELKAGDTLVLKFKHHLTYEAAYRLRDTLKMIAPEGVKVAVLEQDQELQVIKAA